MLCLEALVLVLFPVTLLTKPVNTTLAPRPQYAFYTIGRGWGRYLETSIDPVGVEIGAAFVAHVAKVKQTVNTLTPEGTIFRQITHPLGTFSGKFLCFTRCTKLSADRYESI